MIDIWTVYEHPRDLPDWFVARLWISDQPTTTVIKAKTLDELRALLPQGMSMMPRHELDDPCIVETWL